MGTACLFLAGKVEETPKPLKEVVRVCYLVQHKQEYESAIRHIQQKVRLPLCFALDCTPARFEVALTIHPHSIAQDNLEEQKEKVLQAERVCSILSGLISTSVIRTNLSSVWQSR